jgi:hypothetical protein
MRLSNWYPRQRRFLRCGNLPTVPSGGANAANGGARGANARGRTPPEARSRARKKLETRFGDLDSRGLSMSPARGLPNGRRLTTKPGLK